MSDLDLDPLNLVVLQANSFVYLNLFCTQFLQNPLFANKLYIYSFTFTGVLKCLNLVYMKLHLTIRYDIRHNYGATFTLTSIFIRVNHSQPYKLLISSKKVHFLDLFDHILPKLSSITENLTLWIPISHNYDVSLLLLYHVDFIDNFRFFIFGLFRINCYLIYFRLALNFFR